MISFDGETSGSSAGVNRIELPAGLSLAIGLETALDLETARVGDLISAKVQSDVKHKGVVLVPKGAIISGRLRRLEKYTDDSAYFVVGLEFSELDFPGNRARFFAELQQITPPAGTERIAKMPTPRLPGVGTFSVTGNGLRLAAGLRMVWKTTHYSEENTTSAHH